MNIRTGYTRFLPHPPTSCSICRITCAMSAPVDNNYVPHHHFTLHVQILHFQRVFLDELSSRFHFIAHQNAEQVIGGRGVVHGDF